MKEKYYKDDAEKSKARARRRYYKKKEEILEKNKVYRSLNKDKMRDYARDYRNNKENKVKINIRARHYQSKLRNNIIVFVGKCQLCGSQDKLELHHDRYDNNFDNLRVLCLNCHKEIHRKVRFGDLAK